MKTVSCAALLAIGLMSSTAAAQFGAPPSDFPAGTSDRLFLTEEAPRGMSMPLRFRRISLPAVTAPAQVTEPLPADAQALMNVFDREADEMRKKLEQEIQTRRQTLINALQALQDSYTRDAKLDEAVAIRNTIRQLKVSHLHPLPNPGNLMEYTNRIGEVVYFDVVGQTGPIIWGSEVYTCDSDLATAAVHAGVLKPGEQGVVKVTIVKSPETHTGSTQHGVSSSPWGPFTASYTVESPFANPQSTSSKTTQGMRVEVEWKGIWFRAEVLESKGDQTRIHYTGYADTWDEWVGPDRIRPLQPQNPEPLKRAPNLFRNEN